MDTGASSGFTFCKKDFVTLNPFTSQVSGLGKLSIKGKGTSSYKINNSTNQTVDLIIVNTFYVPDLHIRLLSPQQISKQSMDPEAGLMVRENHCKLTWDYHVKVVTYSEMSQLPIMYTSPGGYNIKFVYAQCLLWKTRSQTTKINLPKSKSCSTSKCKQCHKDDIPAEQPTLPDSNVSKETQDLLTWHERLGHTNFKQIQTLARNQYLPTHIETVISPYVHIANLEKHIKDL